MSARWMSLALVLLLAGPAAAQDQPAAPDVGGWLGDDTPPPAQPAQAQDPLAAPAAPADDAPAADAAAPAAPVDPQEERRRSRQIDRNYQAALDIYQDMDDPRHQVTNLDRRIANNERLTTDYRRRLQQAQEKRRQSQVELYNRVFFLRQQLERGQVTQDVFDRLARQEEVKHEERTATLKGDIEAWTKEVREGEQRLEAMRAERRMLEAMNPRPKAKPGQAAGAPAQRPGARLVGSLEERLRQLDRFEPRNTMDQVHPRDVGVGSQ